MSLRPGMEELPPEHPRSRPKVICNECPGRVCNITQGKPADCTKKQLAD